MEKLYEFLKIDVAQLDKEWLEQSTLMFSATEELSDSKFAVDKANSNLERVKAEVGSDIRANPAKYGLSKTTESAINEVLVQTAEYQRALSKVIDSKHLYEKRKAFVTALEQRKSALENLVRLYSLGYFSLPEVENVNVTLKDKVKIK